MAKTVLIVEDNELNMKLFRDLLEAHGYQTSGTSNGFEALDLVRKLRPDLILMDIQLPQVSGLEVTRWIKDDPDLRTQRLLCDAAHVVTVERHRAFGRIVKSRDQTEQRAFSGARAANDRHDLARRDGKIDILQDGAVVIVSECDGLKSERALDLID